MSSIRKHERARRLLSALLILALALTLSVSPVAIGKNWTMKKIGAKATSLTIKKLQPGKKYEVRVRTFKKSGNKTVYGPWSKTMKSGAVKR
jgi:hypothetical protein